MRMTAIPNPAETFLAAVGPLVVINLPYRTDRRAEFSVQLRRIGLSLEHPQVHVFDAIRPDTADGFPTIGTRGCFLSHLGALKKAQAAGWDRVLICEDDLDFTPDAFARLPQIATSLGATSWSMFYGGYGDPPPGPTVAPDLVEVDPKHGIFCAHFYAVRGAAIADLIRYLEAILSRPPGHPDGGLMHYDGALAWFRAAHPHHITLATVPALGVQRSSRTDIHALRWFDRFPVFRGLAALLRRMRR
jgi:glycosyl transferase, family 25